MTIEEAFIKNILTDKNGISITEEKNLYMVTKVDISSSKLEKIPEWFSFLPNVISIRFSNNKIEKIENLDKCINITSLDFNGNKI